MQLKDFSVFIDVERLEAGKFDNNLLNSIRQAKNFLLVLTPNALDRCIGDNECKDWVHRVCIERIYSHGTLSVIHFYFIRFYYINNFDLIQDHIVSLEIQFERSYYIVISNIDNTHHSRQQ